MCLKASPIKPSHCIDGWQRHCQGSSPSGDGTDPFASQEPNLTSTSANSQVCQENHRDVVSILPHRAHFTESPPRPTPMRGRNIFVCWQQEPSKPQAGRAELQYQLSATESQLCPRYHHFFFLNNNNLYMKSTDTLCFASE